MRIKIQERRPYQDAIRWQMSSDYFQNKGAQAFLDKEVPFNVTSNQAAALQNAQMVLESLALQNLASDQPIRILEFASGLGIFALNFLKMFERLCQTKNLDYFERIEYWMTDFSDKTLRDVVLNPFYQKHIQQGKLKLFHFDTLEGQTLTELDGVSHCVNDYRFSAFIANYHHCTLPLALLLYQDGQFMEMEVESYAWLAGSLSQSADPEQRQQVLCQLADKLNLLKSFDSIPVEYQASLKQALTQVTQLMIQEPVAQKWSAELDLQACLLRWLLEATQDFLKQAEIPFDDQVLQAVIAQDIVNPLFDPTQYTQYQLQEIHHSNAIELDDYCRDAVSPAILRELVNDLDKATLSYPFSSLQSFQKLMPTLHDYGIYLISDKAYTDLDSFKGLHQDVPSIHGNSIAHMVNYPFFEKWFQRQNYATCVMHDSSATLHVLMVLKAHQMPLELAEIFDETFVKHNHNMDSQFFLEAGGKLLKHDELETAIKLFLRAFKHRSEDTVLLMNLAACYIKLKKPQAALRYLEMPNDNCFFMELFASWRAEAYRALGQYQKAIENYLVGLDYFGKNLVYQVNLAKCYAKLSQVDQALHHLQMAQLIEPENEEVLSLMETILYQAHS